MASDTRIRVLPVHVANKIAAGEVVERPASVVKELIENAVDAGATQIELGVTAGGRKRIAVRDNGCGMSRDDALLSIEAHATSKIHDVDDIENIRTLGFRGEALAAIASASRFRLTTAVGGGEAGTEVTVAGGQIQDVREVGCPAGTTFEVRDLFYNIPARRKFLRAHQTELGHIRACFLLQALANVTVGMSLNVDGHDVYRLAPAGQLVDRLRELFGPDYLATLLPLSLEGPIRIHGFISKPGVTRADREEQYVFVNNRATSSPVVNYAIREGFHTALPKDRHPSVFLYLEMDPQEVDVNVHPTKREVRFRRPSDVRDAIMAAITNALTAAGARREVAPATDDEAFPIEPGLPPRAQVQMHIEGLPATRAFPYPRMSGPDAYPRPPEQAAAGAADAPPESGAGGGGEPGAGGGADAPAAPWSWCRVVGVIGGQYVLLETEDGMVVMDPAAAHERVLFERFMADVARKRVTSQQLLIPETLALPPSDAQRVRKHLDFMKSIGFGVAEFGHDTFVVDGLPAAFQGASAHALLTEVAAGFEALGARRGQGRWREEVVARAACRAAVKRRDRLELTEVERLVVDLARTAMPYTCPRGRPTLIFTAFKELERKFGRV